MDFNVVKGAIKEQINKIYQNSWLNENIFKGWLVSHSELNKTVCNANIACSKTNLLRYSQMVKLTTPAPLSLVARPSHQSRCASGASRYKKYTGIIPFGKLSLKYFLSYIIFIFIIQFSINTLYTFYNNIINNNYDTIITMWAI